MQHDPGQDAFNVRDRAEVCLETAVTLVQQQLPDGVITQPEFGLIADRPGQPAAEQTPAHRRCGGVDHAEQAVGLIRHQAGFKFQITPGNGVYLEVSIGLFQLRALEVRQQRLLGVVEITDQGPERADRRVQAPEAQPVQINAGILLPDRLFRATLVEIPVGPPAQAGLPLEFSPLLK